jgi:hypothetical protein
MKEDLIDTKLSLDLAYAMQKLKLTIVSYPKSKENAQLAKDVLKNTKIITYRV